MHFPIYSQDIIKSGGKQNVEELKVTENSEEMMAKNYAVALERMQNALKREAQIKIVKQMTERKKVDVCTEPMQKSTCSPSLFRCFFYIVTALNSQTNKHGFIGKLQSQVQRSDLNEISDEFNVPESWKWENQTELKERKERKGKQSRRKRQ